MSRKAWSFLAIVVIILVAAFDYQYSMYPETLPLPEAVRRIGHLLTLIVVMLCGGFAMAKVAPAWVRAIWWYGYLLALAVLLVLGVIAHFIDLNYQVLFASFNFRVFFCSPLPFFILSILSRLKKDGQS